MFVIPTRQDLLDYEIIVSLSEVRYALRFTWSEREEAWYMDLRTDDGSPLALGTKITLGHPLMWHRRGSAFPAGYMMALDTSGRETEARVDDLGTRVQIVYYERGEV